MKFQSFKITTAVLASLGLLAPAQAAFGQSGLQQPYRSEHLMTVQPQQLLNSSEQKLIANILIWLSYLLPSGLVLGIFLSDKYYAYRAAMLKQQIERLERLWQSSLDNDATTDPEWGTRN